MSKPEQPIASVLTEIAAEAGAPPARLADAAWRAGRRRRLATLAGSTLAGAAAIAIISVGLALGLQRPAPPTGPVPPAGLPSFYLQEGQPNGPFHAMSTVVRATATGAVTATVRCPSPQGSRYIWPMAADSHRTFFIVCGTWHGQSVTDERIYRFRVTSTGQQRGYAPVPGGDLGAVHVGSMAVSSDGSRLAVIVSWPGAAQGDLGTPAARIIVINTRTGARAIWRNAPAAPGVVQFDISDVSLTGHGRELVFSGLAFSCRATPRASCQRGHLQVRALGTATGGGLLSSSRVLLHPNKTGIEIAAVAASTDGAALTIVSESTAPASRPSWVTVFQINVKTLRYHVIYHIHGASGKPVQMIFFGPDASDRHFLISVGPLNHPAVGWIDHGKIIKLKPFHNWVFDEAW